MQQPRILVVGAGKLGLPLAQRLTGSFPTAVLSRNPPAASGLLSIAADVTRPEALVDLPSSLELVVYSVAPGRFDEAAYRDLYVTGLENLLRALQQNSLKRILFVSSTGVYHQNDDSWVDETSPTDPTAFSGRCILEAEEYLCRAGVPHTVIRFSGIYGGDRTRLLEQILAGEIDPSLAGPYTNRIHEEDCIGILEHLVRLSMTGQPLQDCYLASDSEPVPISTIVRWVEEQVGPIRLQPSAGPAPGRAGSKRCCNRRLLESGYRFRYPSFREGYQALLERLKA